MPLTQPPKDAAVAAQQNSNTTLAAWPDDVPEKAALVSQAGTLLAGIQAAVVPPPPVGQQPDPLLICDIVSDPYNIGGISARYFYTPYLAWTPGGEWKDKNGTLCGKVPFVTSALIPYGAPAQLINIDVNALMKPGVQPQICLRGKAQGNTAPQIRFNSREVNAMMSLQYRYDDNTTESVN